MHRLWVVWRFLLVPVDLLVSQLPIEVVLVEGEGEGELDVIRKLAFKHVEPLHLNHEDPRQSLHPVLDHGVVNLVAVLAATICLEGGAFEVVSQAVEEVNLVIVDVVRATFLLVKDHGECEAEEVFWSSVCELAGATDDLPLQLSLEDLGHESDLFIGEGDSAHVAKRGLSQVVEEAE